MNFDRKVHKPGRLSGPAMMVVAVVMAPLPAAAAIGDWHGEGKAQVRLVGAGIDANGQISAGIEIALEPGWKTYWRTPGDAGVAPLIDFSASRNIDGPVLVEYPVPHRVDDGYAVSNVYEDHVVFPLSVAVADPHAPAGLVVSLDIGVCAEICIPEHYDLVLDLAPGEGDAEAAVILSDARARLPRGPAPGAFAAARIDRTGGTDKRPVFEVAIVAPDVATAEVFVEGPFDWYPAPPKLVSIDGMTAVFAVEFSRLGAKTPIGRNRFTVTIVAGGEAIEDTVTLD